MGINKQQIMGRLGKDPEVKTVGDTQVATVSVAVSEKWKDKKGEQQERTEWFEVNFWGKDAENIQRFFKKGDGIYVEGPTQTRTYDDKDGVKRYRTSVLIQRRGWTGMPPATPRRWPSSAPVRAASRSPASSPARSTR